MRLSLLAVLALALTSCVTVQEAEPSPLPEPTSNEVAGRLSAVFDVIEREQVTVLRDGRRCRLIEYRGGTYAAASAEWCSEEAANQPVAFTDEATADFAALVGALDVGRATFSSVSDVEFASNGQVARATFEFFYTFGSELLVFDPGYQLPADDPGETWHEVVDEDWYLVRVDWN